MLSQLYKFVIPSYALLGHLTAFTPSGIGRRVNASESDREKNTVKLTSDRCDHQQIHRQNGFRSLLQRPYATDG